MEYRGGTGAKMFTVLAVVFLCAAALGQERIAAPTNSDRRTYPITLPAAFRLANTNPIDIAVACERLEVALARHQRAKVLWLPTVQLGMDYARQDGRIQDVAGTVFTTSRSSVMVGAGPAAVISTSDAVYGPLAARQVVCARRAEVDAAGNDSLLHVAESYVNVQRSRGEAAGALEVARRAEDLLNRVEKLAPGLIPSLEINRARADYSKRMQAIESAYEHWEVASAELARLLRLDGATMVEPAEPPDLKIDLIDGQRNVDELIPIALTARPELAAYQAVVQATIARLKHEKMRPLMPSVLLRGNATNPAGNLSTGYFGGGVNDNLTNFGGRNSVDVQFVWELQNLGFGNRATVREREADKRLAVLELFRLQDRVASEVVKAHAQSQRAGKRLALAQEGLQNAITAADLNLLGLSQTKPIGETLVLVIRPQEVIASIAALDQAYRDYSAATAEVNTGQFRLYHALGHSAQCVNSSLPTPSNSPTSGSTKPP